MFWQKLNYYLCVKSSGLVGDPGMFNGRMPLPPPPPPYPLGSNLMFSVAKSEAQYS